MQVWIRIAISCDGEDDVKLDAQGLTVGLRFGVTIYPSEQAAKSAAAKYGGIALSAESGSLVDLFERDPEEQKIEGVLVMDRDDELSPRHEKKGSFLIMDCSSLPGAKEYSAKEFGSDLPAEVEEWVRLVEDEMDASFTI